MSWQAVVPEPSELGESPFWHPLEQMLYWVDILGKKILRTNVFMGTVQCWSLPIEPGCIAPAASGGLVMALRDGIYRAQEWGGALTLIQRFGHDTATTRFNDGKADPLGRFWAGTMYEPRDVASAELFSVDCRRTRTPEVQRMAGDATIANGLAWSPDAKTVYWSDTLRHMIQAWDWDADSNAMSGQRMFHQFPLKPADWTYAASGATDAPAKKDGAAYGGRPDGADVDAQGNYYVAMYEGARLLKFAPGGELLGDIPAPVLCPTMPCFGGDDMKTLFLTTARHNRSPQELADMPLSGCVFSMRVDVPGRPANFFRD